jgi:biopolymer transport protein ExbB/TolQ
MNLADYLNLSAALCFVWLFYRLAMLGSSAFIRFRQLKANTEVLHAFNAACQQQVDAGHLSVSLSQAATIVLFDRPNAEFVVTKLKEIILLQANDLRHSDQELSALVERQAMQYTKHFQLADLANSIGMAYTVAGGILVFNCIGASDDPFAAFPGLELAMITTLAGLMVSIPTREILTAYAARVDTFETLANELTSHWARVIKLANTSPKSRPAPQVLPSSKNLRPRAESPMQPTKSKHTADPDLTATNVGTSFRIPSTINGKVKVATTGDRTE